jgi:hypothetical protein
MFLTLNRYWLLLFLMILGYGLLEYYRVRPLDWSSTYSNKDKIPFGGEVMYKLLPEMIGGEKVESLRIPPYNQLAKDAALPPKSTYIFISELFKVDNNDQRSLLDYVKNGNVVFVSAYHFSADSLMGVLGVMAADEKPDIRDSARAVYFVNPHLRDKNGQIFKKDKGQNYLKIKGSKATLLAVNEDRKPVFVKINYGKGQFYIHNLPLAFTNYYVLDPQTNQHALSYLPQQPVFWDEYQKQGRFAETERSVFRYIVSTPGLKSAYFLSLIGLILYAIFTGKRRQRIIPVITPPKNVSLDFVKTIGNMYFRKGNHTNLANKLIQHFWIYVKERFGVGAGRFTESELVKIISQKSGLTNSETEILIQEISDENRKWTGRQLIELNHKLEDFYKRTK